MDTTTTRGIPDAAEMIAIYHRDIGRTDGHYQRGLIGKAERDDRIAQRLRQIEELRREVTA